MTGKSELRLPNFVVGGAPKCGTTSLYFYLAQHPDVFLPARKELHYFSYKQLLSNTAGPGDFEALRNICGDRITYEGHYAMAGTQRAIGEISPSYLYYGEASRRINEELGKIKILFMLRDPTEKAYSQYMHQVRQNLESLSFEDALDAEEERRRAGWSDIWRYAESSLYAERVQRYVDVFGFRNVKVIVFEEFISDTTNVLRSILEYLGVDIHVPINTSGVYNKTGEPRSRILGMVLSRPNPLKWALRQIFPERLRTRISLAMLRLNTGRKETLSEDLRERLKAYFREDVEHLEEVLARRLPWCCSEADETQGLEIQVPTDRKWKT